MAKRIILVTALLFLVACSSTTTTTPATTTTTTPGTNTNANARLETTPRHDEWITIDSAGRKLQAYIVYPQVSKKAGSVIVIHENRGLTDWVRTVADRLAENGYIAIAPDLLSGAGPNGGRTSDFPTSDAAREAISKLPREQVMTDLTNTLKYVRALPSANGRIAVAGFCWGGSRAFDFAAVGENISATFVFYGTGPQDDATADRITGPVYGFYGGADERVNATIPGTQAVMDRNFRRFNPEIYPEAGHAFMRLGEEFGTPPANRRAREAGWARLLSLLSVIQ